MWPHHHGKRKKSKKATEKERKLFHKRAKWYVYQFFMAQERINPDYFPSYPACFQLWTTVELKGGGEFLNGPECMYPAKGLEAPRDMMRWKILHCPWYLKNNGWDMPFGDWKKLIWQQNNSANSPAHIFKGVKEGDEQHKEVSAKQVNDALEKQTHHANHSRNMKSKELKTEEKPSVSNKSKLKFKLFSLTQMLALALALCC
jgi:hypothetical protein